MPDLKELQLWSHQRSAIQTCDRYFEADIRRAALVQMPTGTGKTGVMAAISSRRAAALPVLIVCPSAALVEQLQSEIGNAFWDRIGAGVEWKPEQLFQLLPSELPALVTRLDRRAPDARVIVIGTVQALQQIHSNEQDYERLKGKFGTVLFDEGHREPATSWAIAVRRLGAPTILFSATPFRNDLKIFDVDLDHVEFLGFQRAVSDGLIRGVEIQDSVVSRGPADFARAMVALRDALVGGGRFSANHKMIVRADHVENVRALFDGFVTALRGRDEGVLALHNTFKQSGPPGAQIRPDVPTNLRTRTERFLIHQFMLTEGIDDPACTMLALYEPFSTERQLVQQVGRLTRHPGPLGTIAPKALVLARPDDDVSQMWDRFLKFDTSCETNGGRPPVRNDAAVMRNMVAALPEVDYAAGKFRTRLNLHADLSEEIRVPLSAVVFAIEDNFMLDDFCSAVSTALTDEDRYEVSHGAVAGGDCRYHLSLRLNQSPFLADSLFHTPSLELTIYSKQGTRLYFYDSAGLWINEVEAVRGRLPPEQLRTFAPDHLDCVVTSLAMKNTDLGPLALRSRMYSSRSLESSGTFTGEQLNVVTRATARVGAVRRGLGFVRSRLRQGEGPEATPEQFHAWAESLEQELTTGYHGRRCSTGLPTPFPRREIRSRSIFSLIWTLFQMNS
jgi:Type III restriction enzyme, res subunit